MWYLLELNQGHMDFQSIALPPELRYQSKCALQSENKVSGHPFCRIAGAKIRFLTHLCKLLTIKFTQFNFLMYLCTRNRDVAQLVAYYVRDVGVGRSSRLIPTDGSRKVFFLLLFLLFTMIPFLPSWPKKHLLF